MSFEYHEPTTLSEAIDLLARYGKTARLLAGGTDLMVLVSRNKVDLAHLISLDSVPGLSGIRQDERGNLVLGSMTTHREIETSPLMAGAGSALPQACRTVGGVQVRNLGTIGGNLCNASPAADTAPVLLAIDADVTLQGPEGSRNLPLNQFLLGPRKTALGPGEILTSITIPRFSNPTATLFLKAGRRKAMEISLCSVAARLTLGEDGTADVRVGLGSVAPKAIRAVRAESVLQGQVPTLELIREAGATAATECTPISDVRGSAEYRQMLVESLVTRALSLCLDQLRNKGQATRVS
jgi:carbon-monoxide dehydrogenase medium subunit